METKIRYFVGVDWATEDHLVWILNASREKVECRKYLHSGAGLSEFADRLTELSADDPSCIAVGIETPRGAVVELLVERGFCVYSLNPKQMDRFRDRHSPSGAKDDSRDGYVIADALATDLHKFHRVRLDDPFVIRIRELGRSEEDLRQTYTRVRNRLREQLHRYYPQMLELSESLDEPWLWTLLEKAPLPWQAAKLSETKIQRILKEHRIRRITAADVRTILQSPALRLAPGAAEAASEHVLLLLPQLLLCHEQIHDITKRMDALLDQMSAEGQRAGHRDVNILRSLPGVGRCIAATMLAEAAQALAERDYHALRCYGGLAPVTKQSGKKKTVVMRKACNERLRNAFYHWPLVSMQQDPRSRQHYQTLRAKGHTHGRALRGVADRLLAMLIDMLRTGTEYDPAKRNGVAAQPA